MLLADTSNRNNLRCKYIVRGCSVPSVWFKAFHQGLSFTRHSVRTENNGHPLYSLVKLQGPVSQKILSPLVILSMEKTMVTKLIRELKSVSRLKILPETRPRSLLYGTCLDSRVFDFLISCQTWPYSLRSEGSLWIPRPTAQFYKGFYSQFLASICPRHPLPGIRSGFL